MNNCPVKTLYQAWVTAVTQTRRDLCLFNETLWDLQGKLLLQNLERFPPEASKVTDLVSLESLCEIGHQMRVRSRSLEEEVETLRVPDISVVRESYWKILQREIAPRSKKIDETAYNSVIQEDKHLREEVSEMDKRLSSLRRVITENRIFWENILLEVEKRLSKVQKLYVLPLEKVQPMGPAHILLGHRRQMRALEKEYKTQSKTIQEICFPDLYGQEITLVKVRRFLQGYHGWLRENPSFKGGIDKKIEGLGKVLPVFEEITGQREKLGVIIKELEESMAHIESLVYLAREGTKDELKGFFEDYSGWPGDLTRVVLGYLEKV